MVGYRNVEAVEVGIYLEFIRHSDGGVSELNNSQQLAFHRVYQAFRWWGIGTVVLICTVRILSLSGIPMVGYRNHLILGWLLSLEFIRHSDGGVSERKRCNNHHNG